MISLTMRPVLEAMLLAVTFLCVVLAFHLTLRRLARGESQATLLRSLLVVAVLMVLSVHGVPFLLRFLPASVVRHPVAVAAAALLPCSWIITRVVCDVNGKAVTAAAVIFVAMSIGLQLLGARAGRLFHTAGPSFSDYLSQGDHALMAARNGTGRDGRKSPGILRTGLDAMATLTSQGSQEGLKGDLSRGISMFAERKKQMDEMSPEDRAEYRVAMSNFLSEQGLSANPNSLARLSHVSTNDITALADAFAQMNSGKSAEGRTSQAGVRATSESMLAIMTNLHSVAASAQDVAMLKQVVNMWSSNDLANAVAKVKADFAASGGQNSFALALLAGLHHLEPKPLAAAETQAATNAAPVQTASNAAPSHTAFTVTESDARQGAVATNAPREDETRMCVAEDYGRLWVRGKTEGMKSWLAAAQNLQVKGCIQSRGRGAVLLTNGELLEVGQPWTSTVNGVTYTFLLEAASDNQVHLVLQGSASKHKERSEIIH